jgi:putative metalloenzyme radical SAM/SPASM domain maturase
MKQNPGGEAVDGDLAPETFVALEPALPRLESLVLNGVGEPLLNLRLEQYIGRARRLMPANAWIGLQSNGLLLTNLRAVALVDAGLDRICLSMDGVTPDTFRTVREGGELADLDHALAAMAAAKVRCGRDGVQVGIEFVLMRDNRHELPAALRWAAQRQVSFAIVSQLLPYAEAHTGQRSYDLCTDEAIALFHVWQDKARVTGVRIDQYFDILWKYRKSAAEQRIVGFVESMKADARRLGINLDLKRLLALDYDTHDELFEIFAEARQVAAETGIDLRLPELLPRESRRCDFVEQGGAFVGWDGLVHPCYYLWHRCHSYASGWLHPVKPRVFGNLARQGLLEIWNGGEFRTYRQNVLSTDYPFCPGCAFAPCDYVQADQFEQDCHVNAEPCGCCLWSAGLFNCLT